MFFRFGLTGIAAVVIIGGVVLYGELTAPVPETPCPTVTRDEVAARGQSFASSFFTSQYTSNGILVRAADGITGRGVPRCFQLFGVERCAVDGETTVGVSYYNRFTFYDVPAGMRAEIAVPQGDGPACGLAPADGGGAS